MQPRGCIYACRRSGSDRETEVFASLGDETRLQLIARLTEAGPQSIASLAGGFDNFASGDLEAPARHQRRRTCRSGRRGREVVWQLDEQGLADAQRYLQAISRDWDVKLRRLKDVVE